MTNQRGSSHLPIILALFFGAAVVVLIFGYMLWPKDEEITSTSTIDTNKVVNVNTANENTNATNGNVNATATTKDWKTYTHPTLKYSIKYPKDWSVYTCPDVTSAWFGTQKVVCDSEGPTDDFGIVQQTADFNLNTTLAATKEGMTNSTQTTIKIAGTSGTRLTGSSQTALFGSPSYADYVFFQHNGRYFIVSYIVAGTQEKLKTEFENFISTLEFKS